MLNEDICICACAMISIETCTRIIINANIIAIDTCIMIVFTTCTMTRTCSMYFDDLGCMIHARRSYLYT